MRAAGVVIRNSRIVGSETPSSIGFVSNVISGAPFTISDSEIYAAYPTSAANGIFGSNFTAERVNVHDVVDAVKVIGSNVVVRNSWLHGNLHYESDPARGGTPTHDDSIQIEAGTGILIEGSKLENAHNAAIQITQNTSKTSLGAITIRDNYLDNGGCTVNIAATPGIIHPSLSDNVFGVDRTFSTCAVIAPATNAPSLNGNIWAATGNAMSSYVPLK